MKKDWNSHIRAKDPIDVTPAKAGVQKDLKRLDSGFRRNDEQRLLP